MFPGVHVMQNEQPLQKPSTQVHTFAAQSRSALCYDQNHVQKKGGISNLSTIMIHEKKTEAT